MRELAAIQSIETISDFEESAQSLSSSQTSSNISHSVTISETFSGESLSIAVDEPALLNIDQIQNEVRKEIPVKL